MTRHKTPISTAIDPRLADELDEFVRDNPPWRKVDAYEEGLRMFLAEKKADRGDKEADRG